MPIPTMAIACRPENTSSGPAVSTLLSGVIDSVETHVENLKIPTHLGFGIRFDLSSSDMSSEGKKLDVSCRIDLVSIDLGTSGPDADESLVHPTPAVHLDAHLWEMDLSGSQGHLLGSPESPTRLRSVDMHLGWYANDVEDNGTVITESVWDASIILNDAAFQNHMDWPALGDATEYLEKIPGRLVIDGMNSAAGAMECLGALVADYAEGQAEEVFESLLSGLSSMGIATKLGYDSLDDNIEWEDLPWTLDQLAIQTFLSDPIGFLSNIIYSPTGEIDLSTPLPYGELSTLEALSNLISGSMILDDPLDSRHGALLFDIPLPFSNSLIHVNLKPSGEIGLNTDSIGLGPLDLYSSLSMPLLSPDEWADGPSISLTIQAASHVSGILDGCALVLTKNSPWTVTLELPDSGVVPSFTNGFNLVQPPSMIHLSDSDHPNYHSLNDLFDYIPGMILDSAIGILIENMLSNKVDKSESLGIVLSEFELVTWDSFGGLSANSIFPIIEDPVGHLLSCFTNSQGLDVVSILNVVEALFGLIPSSGIQSFNQLGELIDSNAVSSVSKIVIPVSIFEIVFMENPDSFGSFTIGIQPNSELSTSLIDNDIDVSALLRVNVNFSPSSPYLNFDLDGSFMDLNLDFSSILSGISSSGTLQIIINALSNANATIHLEMISGTLHLSSTIDFDPSDPNSLPAMIQILPFSGGIDTFLLRLVSSLFESLLPDLIEYAIEELKSIPFYTGMSIGAMIEDMLVQLELWNSELNMGNFENFCTNPGDYLKQGNRIINLINSAVSHVYAILPDTDGGIIQVTNHSGWISIKLNHPDPDLAWLNDNLSLDIGQKYTSGEPGIWLCYSQIISFISGNIPISLEVGMYRNTSEIWRPSTLFNAYVGSALMTKPFTIQPAIRFGYDGDDFDLVISTGVDTGASTDPASTGTESFWMKVLPRSGTWTRDVDWGMPNLSAMLLGAADIALNFAEEPIQEFLLTPIYTNTSSSGGWEEMLSELTIVGDWLVNLGICSFGDEENGGYYPGSRPTPLPSPPPPPTPAPQTFYIRPLSNIISEYTDDNLDEEDQKKYPFKRLLKGSMDMLIQVINRMGASYSNGIKIYERNNSNPELFDFSISLNVQNSGNQYDLGINFDFEDQSIEIGNMDLKIFTRSDSEEDYYGEDWATKSSGNYSSGLTVQLLSYDSTPTTDLLSAFSPFFSIEIGHLGLQLAKKDLQPMLDGFLLLKTVTATICMDYTHGSDIEFGGRLDLDDFGISLGGNSSNNGGNSLAAGVLDGGEGKDSVRPMFDIAIWCYDGKLDAQIRGSMEYWFSVNKQFGPIKIAQIGVKFDSSDNRLSILVDGEAEIAGFLAQVDDLSVSMPIFDLLNFDEWKYDMAGCAISYTGPAFSIAGALRKTLVTPAGGGDEYIEYQGLCTISTTTMAINAIGAFGRVPVDDDEDSYVTCFVIAAIETTIGGPPMFFVTGLLGGLGLNRELVTPDVSMVTSSPFMLAMDSSALASDPMGALESIRTHLPAEKGSFWFAVGVKFTTFQVIESKAVLYIKISDDFAIGLIGLSAMSLPTPDINIGYIELAFAASYDSGTNIFRAEAQLTDASYLFSKSCRLTGGFALVNWFNRGDFLLSIGGYHPKFKVPSHYPAVPRLGFNWKPMSKIVIKGDAYFTVCSSAVMLGGGFEASYKSGCLSASFYAGVDVLIVFDPFFYSFRVYIGVSVRLKTWLGTLKAGLGADIEIEGPKMRGKARIEVVFIEFTVKFGSTKSGSPNPISGLEFMNKHILQRPEGEFKQPFQGLFSNKFSLVQPVKGLIRSENGESPDEDEALNGPFNLEPEFEFSFSHLFPSQVHSIYLGSEDNHDSKEITNNWRTDVSLPSQPFDIVPCHIDKDTNGAPFSIEIFRKENDSSLRIPTENEYNLSGLSYVSTLGHFSSTLWEMLLDNDNKPKGRTSAPENQPRYLNGGSLSGRSVQFPLMHCLTIDMNQVEKSVFVHNLPLTRYFRFDPGTIVDWSAILTKIGGIKFDLDSGKVSENSKKSSSSSKREPGFRSFSMGGLEAVLQGGKEKHELNRKTLDARSGLRSFSSDYSKFSQSNLQGDKL